jgi:AraC-like DNA-binding protein
LSADRLDANKLHDALEVLHRQVFVEWLDKSLIEQSVEIERYLRGNEVLGCCADTFADWVPDSARPNERLLFRTELGTSLMILGAERQIGKGSQINGKPHWAVTEAVQHAKAGSGDIGLTLKGLSAIIGMTPAHLGRIFRQNTGTRFRKYLQALRIFKATALVRSPISIRTISDLLGYSSVTNFRRDFMQTIGCSPTRYR